MAPACRAAALAGERGKSARYLALAQVQAQLVAHKKDRALHSNQLAMLATS